MIESLHTGRHGSVRGIPGDPGERGHEEAPGRFAQDQPELSALARALGNLVESMPEGAVDAARIQEALGGPDAMSIVDRILNLGPGGHGSLGDLSKENLEDALKILVDLLRHGVVGYEYREVNGRPQKLFIDVAIGSDLHRAPLYRGGRLDGIL